MSGKDKKNDSDKKDEIECIIPKKPPHPPPCPPVQNVTHPLRYYEFTQDELKALEECDKESFYQRCLPFSTLFATATYAAIKWGFLKKNPHFGVYPKIILAALIGHFYGRYAYIPLCDKKLRCLPENSYLGKVMRKHYCERHPPKDPKKKC